MAHCGFSATVDCVGNLMILEEGKALGQVPSILALARVVRGGFLEYSV
jgi:hypothetical protein